MLRILAVLAVVLGTLMPAAHVYRWNGLFEALAWLAPACLLFTRRAFVRLAVQAVMGAGVVLTFQTTAQLMAQRQAMGLPWGRMAAIMAAAALLPALGAVALNHPFFAPRPVARPAGSAAPEDISGDASRGASRDALGDALGDATGVAHGDTTGVALQPASKITLPTAPGAPREAAAGPALTAAPKTGPASAAKPAPLALRPVPRPAEGSFRPDTGWPGFAAFVLALAGLALVQWKAPPGMLLAERFAVGSGWLEAVLLALYAGFVAEALLEPGRAPTVRRRIWTFFSLVFFAQLGLGLAGFPKFFLNSSPHLPVPALIAAGPLFRGEGLFMPVLFTVAALLIGPAWCSHLCYIGAWDRACAGSGPARLLPGWVRRGRVILAGLVLAAAVGLRAAGATPSTAAALAAGFGLAGVGVMLTVSRRTGVMAHCAGYCPMGLFAGLLGRLSPWRLRIGQGCTACGACAKSCRYDALRPQDLAAGRPALSCSLCLDCLERCPHKALALTWAGRSGPAVRAGFAVLAGALCALFLGVARM